MHSQYLTSAQRIIIYWTLFYKKYVTTGDNLESLNSELSQQLYPQSYKLHFATRLYKSQKRFHYKQDAGCLPTKRNLGIEMVVRKRLVAASGPFGPIALITAN
jgi:hypothetical protein